MPTQPLLVHLIFHPRSGESRELAREIHRQLNDETVVPGIRVPTAFCPVSGESRSPAALHLDVAARNFIVALADDRFTIDPAWCRFAGDTWLATQGTDSRCIPFQLSAAAWPLDKRLEGVSFARAYLQPEGEARTRFVVRRLVVELCRYLMNLDSKDDQTEAPVKVFLSHTKVDLDAEPKVTRKLIQALSEDQPIEAWVDSGDIAAGSEFARAIRKGVERTSLLVVLTANYASREWCREEVLLAKEHQRPIVVIDALSRYEVRSFPYLGNIPRIRWNDDPQEGIDLVLKETLRHLHSTALLQRFQQPGDRVFSRPPELATLVGLDAGTNVLYPDPPVGMSEGKRLGRTQVSFTTPLQRLARDPSLKGKSIALSMSESTDIERYGLDPLHQESAMLELSRYLLVKGATLAYGGHMGASGYTQKLLELVRAHNSLDAVEPVDRLIIHRGWPLPRLTVQQLAEQNQVSQVIELPRPSDVDETLSPELKEAPQPFAAEKSPECRFGWARGMTEMRAFQSDIRRSGVAARVVLGGTFGPTVKIAEDGTRSERWYAGRIPGVLEEVLLSVQAGQPVFLLGAFGGAARLIIDLIEGVDRPEATWEYQRQAPFAPGMRKIYESRGVPWMDYPEIVSVLRAKGIRGINTLLNEDEHRALMNSVDPKQMTEILLNGMNKL